MASEAQKRALIEAGTSAAALEHKLEAYEREQRHLCETTTAPAASAGFAGGVLDPALRKEVLDGMPDHPGWNDGLKLTGGKPEALTIHGPLATPFWPRRKCGR